MTVTLTSPSTLFQSVLAGLQLSKPAPLSVTGTVQISFVSNAFGVIDNPQVYYDGGARATSFSFAAGDSSQSLPNIQQGTVAGTIYVEVTNLKQGTNDVLPSAPSLR
jgi:hypothetical protein